MKNIITISREFGAGGGTIGEAVAERLGYYYCDRDIIARAAAQSGSLTAEEIRSFDEKVPVEFGIGQSLFDFYNKPLDEKVFNAQREAIKKVAEGGNCVIVGRNANIILQEYDRSLHVFISASEYFRVKRMTERLAPTTEKKVTDLLHSVDKTRKKHCRHYTGTEFGNAAYYDLCLRSSTIGIDGCVDLICELARK